MCGIKVSLKCFFLYNHYYNIKLSMKFIWQQKIRVLMFSFYVVVFRDQDAGRNHSIKIDNSSFESVEGLKYLGTT